MKRDPKLTTPTRRRPSGIILDFCKDDVGVIDAEPLFIPVRPNEDAFHGDCYRSVKHHQAANGGGIQQGWIIWESYECYLQAEHHAVWIDASGNLVDIVPKPDSETKILFLPDGRNHWNGQVIVRPIHKTLRKDPRIHQIIKDAEDRADRRIEASKKGQPPGPTFEDINRGWLPTRQ